MGELGSFYGGKPGASFSLVKRFDGIDIPENTVYARKYFAVEKNKGNTLYIVPSQEDGGNFKLGENAYLIERTANNSRSYLWKLQECNGEIIKGSSYTLPIIYAEGMLQCFKKGLASTDQVNYNEYVIIDTLQNLHDESNIDNGKIFKRTLNIDNGFCGAEYQGRIIGPKGESGGIHILKKVNSLEELYFQDSGLGIPPEDLAVHNNFKDADYRGWSVIYDNGRSTEYYAYDYLTRVWFKFDSFSEDLKNEFAEKAPINHADDDPRKIYGGGTEQNYGHVKLTNTYDETPNLDNNGSEASIVPSAYALYSLNDFYYKNSYLKPRWKNITEDYDSGIFSANPQYYFPGDYIIKTYNNKNYVAILCDYNYFKFDKNSRASIPENHWIAIVMGFDNKQMNITNTTNGGFIASALNNWLKDECSNIIKSAFGSTHLIPFSSLLTKGNYNVSLITHGFGWTWQDNNYAMLPTEIQIAGTKLWSDLGWSTGEGNRQLELFKRKSFMEIFSMDLGQTVKTFGVNSYGAWLRDISCINPGTSYCIALTDGVFLTEEASKSCSCIPLTIIK